MLMIYRLQRCVEENHFLMPTKHVVRISVIVPEAWPTTEAGANLDGL
jgi:hypothetical protein